MGVLAHHRNVLISIFRAEIGVRAGRRSHTEALFEDFAFGTFLSIQNLFVVVLINLACTRSAESKLKILSLWCCLDKVGIRVLIVLLLAVVGRFHTVPLVTFQIFQLTSLVF